MQIEQISENFFQEKHLSEQPLLSKFMPEQNLLGVLFDNQIEFYRIEPNFELIAEIKGANMLGLQNGKPIDFCFSNDLKTVIYSVSGKKTFITNLEENVDDKPVSIFGLTLKELQNFKIFETHVQTQTYYNCFKSIEFPSQNALDKIFNCSLTHLFTFKENLAKIKTLQKLLNKQKDIFILAALEGQDIKMAFNNTVEFMNFKLSNKSNIDNYELKEYNFDQNNMSLTFYLINEQKNQIRKIKTGNIFQGHGIENVFFVSYNINLITELLKNLKMGYFKTKMNFTETSSRLKTFLQELDLMDSEQNLNDFRNFLKYGINKTQNIQSFYELLGVKKLKEFYDTINSKFDILEDFYDESFLPGFKKVLAMLKDFQYLQEFQMQTFIQQNDLEKLINFCMEVILHLQNFLKIFQQKRLEIKNFVVFLFKWIYQEDAHQNPEEVNQYQFFIDSIVDYKLLFEYLKDEDSVYMFELKQAILDTSLVQTQNFQQTKFECTNQKLENKLKKIRCQLRLKSEAVTNVSNDTQNFTNSGMKNVLNQFQIVLTKATKNFKDVLTQNMNIVNDEIIINTDSQIDFFQEIKKDDQTLLLTIQNNFMTILNEQGQKNFYNLKFLDDVQNSKYCFEEKTHQLVIGSFNKESRKYQIDQIDISQYIKEELRGTTTKLQQVDKTFDFDGHDLTQLSVNCNGYVVVLSKDKIYNLLGTPIDLVSYSQNYKKKKNYKVGIDQLTFKKLKKKKLCIKYYDYKVPEDMKFQLEQKDSQNNKQKVPWEFGNLEYRLYIFEIKKKKHLFTYYKTKDDANFVINYFISVKNNLDSKINKQKLLNFSKYFKAKRFGNYFYNNMLRINEEDNQEQLINKSSTLFQSQVKNAQENIEKDFVLQVVTSFLIMPQNFDTILKLQMDLIDQDCEIISKRIYCISEFEQVLNQEVIEDIKQNMLGSNEMNVQDFCFYNLYYIKKNTDLSKVQIKVQLKNKITSELFQTKIFDFQKLREFHKRYGFSILQFEQDFKLIILSIQKAREEFYSEFKKENIYTNFDLVYFNDFLSEQFEKKDQLQIVQYQLSDQNKFNMFEFCNFSQEFNEQSIQQKQISFFDLASKCFRILKINYQLSDDHIEHSKKPFFTISDKLIENTTFKLLFFKQMTKKNKQKFQFEDDFQNLQDQVAISSTIQILLNHLFKSLQGKVHLYYYFFIDFLHRKCRDFLQQLNSIYPNLPFILTKLSQRLFLDCQDDRFLVQFFYILNYYKNKQDQYENLYEFFLSGFLVSLYRNKAKIEEKLKQCNEVQNTEFLVNLFKEVGSYFLKQNVIQEVNNFYQQNFKKKKVNNIFGSLNQKLKSYFTNIQYSLEKTQFEFEQTFQQQNEQIDYFRQNQQNILQCKPFQLYTNENLQSLDEKFPLFLYIKYEIHNSQILQKKDIYLELSLDGVEFDHHIFQKGTIEIKAKDLDNYMNVNISDFHNQVFDDYKDKNFLKLFIRICKNQNDELVPFDNDNILHEDECTLNFLDIFNIRSQSYCVQEEFSLNLIMMLATKNKIGLSLMQQDSLIDYYHYQMLRVSFFKGFFSNDINWIIQKDNSYERGLKQKAETIQIYNNSPKPGLFDINLRDLNKNLKGNYSVFDLEIQKYVQEAESYQDFEIILFDFLNYFERKPGLIRMSHLIKAIQSIFTFKKFYFNFEFIWTYHVLNSLQSYDQEPTKAIIFSFDEDPAEINLKGKYPKFEFEQQNSFTNDSFDSQQSVEFLYKKRESYLQFVHQKAQYQFQDISETLNQVLKWNLMTLGFMPVDIIDKNSELYLMKELLKQNQKEKLKKMIQVLKVLDQFLKMNYYNFKNLEKYYNLMKQYQT